MKYIMSSLLLMVIVTNLLAQNKDLDAQYFYQQAESAYAKNAFEDCLYYCARAENTLGETNPKILLLQFNAYEGLLQKKTPCSGLLLNKEGINKALDYFFSHIDAQTYPKEKYFEAKKFKEDYENFCKTPGSMEPKVKPYTLQDLGLTVTKVKYNGIWKYLEIGNGPIKEQSSLSGFWVCGTDPGGGAKRMGTNGIEDMLQRINSYQEISLNRCKETFSVKLFVYQKVAGSFEELECVLKTLFIK